MLYYNFVTLLLIHFANFSFSNFAILSLYCFSVSFIFSLCNFCHFTTLPFAYFPIFLYGNLTHINHVLRRIVPDCASFCLMVHICTWFHLIVPKPSYLLAVSKNTSLCCHHHHYCPTTPHSRACTYIRNSLFLECPDGFVCKYMQVIRW